MTKTKIPIEQIEQTARKMKVINAFAFSNELNINYNTALKYLQLLEKRNIVKMTERIFKNKKYKVWISK